MYRTLFCFSDRLDLINEMGFFFGRKFKTKINNNNNKD